jgi:ribonuclease Y
MDQTILLYIIGPAALIVGILAGKFIFSKNTAKKIEEAQKEADRITKEAVGIAETLKKEKLLEAKERFVQLKSEHDKEVFERNRKINDGRKQN